MLTLLLKNPTLQPTTGDALGVNPAISRSRTLLEKNMSSHVVMYSTGSCPYCVMAERLLNAKGVTTIEKIRIDLDDNQRTYMMQKTGRRTVPQIFIGETHVGGFDDLSVLDRSGKLDLLLQTE